MAKLVVLSEGMTGQSYELKVDKTTIGRVEDNTWQIAQASVSSHHCEVLLRGTDVVVKDLNSTNGTFINNKQVSGEAVVKPGDILRLGQVDMRLDTGSGAISTSAQAMRPSEPTMRIPKGVSLSQLEQGPQGLDTNRTDFTKKKGNSNKWFILGGALLLAVIVIAIFIALGKIGGSSGTP